jgi:hypothetical protein
MTYIVAVTGNRSTSKILNKTGVTNHYNPGPTITGRLSVCTAATPAASICKPSVAAVCPVIPTKSAAANSTYAVSSNNSAVITATTTPTRISDFTARNI